MLNCFEFSLFIPQTTHRPADIYIHISNHPPTNAAARLAHPALLARCRRTCDRFDAAFALATASPLAGATAAATAQPGGAQQSGAYLDMQPRDANVEQQQQLQQQPPPVTYHNVGHDGGRRADADDDGRQLDGSNSMSEYVDVNAPEYVDSHHHDDGIHDAGNGAGLQQNEAADDGEAVPERRRAPGDAEEDRSSSLYDQCSFPAPRLPNVVSYVKLMIFFGKHL